MILMIAFPAAVSAMAIAQMQDRCTNKFEKMEDPIDVLDDRGTKTGEVCTRKEVHALGKIHRAVHLYLFDQAHQLLLQRRAQQVDHYPGQWSISVTGHVDAGENSLQAVQRELQEELGIDPTRVNIAFLFTYRQDVAVSFQLYRSTV